MRQVAGSHATGPLQWLHGLVATVLATAVVGCTMGKSIDDEPVPTAQCSVTLDCVDADFDSALERIGQILQARSLQEGGRTFTVDRVLSGVLYIREKEYWVMVGVPTRDIDTTMVLHCYWFGSDLDPFENEIDILNAKLAEAYPNRVELYEPISTGPW